MYVYMYIGMYVYMYVCMYVYMYVSRILTYIGGTPILSISMYLSLVFYIFTLYTIKKIYITATAECKRFI